MRAKYLLILITLIQIYCLNAQVSYNYKLYTTEDGLISNTCYKLFQDSKGYLWIANGNGVSKFNGKSFDNTIDKSYLKYWAVEDFVQNSELKLLINNPDFIYDPYLKKYLSKDSLYSQFIRKGQEELGARSSTTYLDKDFYKIYTLNTLSNKTNDTLYYSYNGKYNYVVLPNNRSNEELNLIKDRNNNIYIYVLDTISKYYSYYSFQKGKLKFLLKLKEKVFKIEKLSKDNLIFFYGFYGSDKSPRTNISIYNSKGLLINKHTFIPLNESYNAFDCIVKENNVWFPSKNGLINYNEAQGFKEFIDFDRNIDTTLITQYDMYGNPWTLKNLVDGNYNQLVFDNNGNIINGDRVFNGITFNDLLPFSLYSNFQFNNFSVSNKTW
ncbi:MAG: hypothetical protein IPH32_12145 [Bacteroidetes bacterium]|nr:hypothetical protein [Bacteroidota bacterium]